MLFYSCRPNVGITEPDKQNQSYFLTNCHSNLTTGNNSVGEISFKQFQFIQKSESANAHSDSKN